MRFILRTAPLLLLAVALVGCSGLTDEGSGKIGKKGEGGKSAVVAAAFAENQVVLRVPGMN